MIHPFGSPCPKYEGANGTKPKRRQTVNQQSDMTATDAKRLFMDFISDLQGIPCGFRIGKIHNGFRAYDSRTGAEIEALPVFGSFHEAQMALREGE